MRGVWIVLIAAACSSKRPPAPLSGSGSGVGSGPSEAGGCNDAHDCKLRGVCGCSCEGVLQNAPPQVVCEESCPDETPCKDYSAICDLGTHKCSAVKKAP